ncbi:MAG: hypothetical protein LBP90_04625, partial [Burkholderiales bacterium]|nr:hypothetical protein [Burkholderiales bacterium]
MKRLSAPPEHALSGFSFGLVLAGLVLAFTGLVLTAPVSASVFTVNSVADVGAGVASNCPADSPGTPNTCRLRDAIAAAANAPSMALGDTIVFNLPAGSVITLSSEMLV